MSCLVIAAVVCSLVLVTRLIYRPMQLLEREIEKVGKGDLSTTPHNKVDIKEFDVLFERIQAVSYTHLDVYKRQGRGGSTVF